MNIENARKIIGDSTTMTAVEVLAFTEAIEQLAEAKRLLKLAVEDINAAEACDTCEYYPVINSDMCQKDDCYKWRYVDEALKLIGGSENE